VDAEDYFIGPDIDITRLHILQPGILLTAIRIPSTWAGAQFYFEKIRDRNVWDFPLMNVASAMVTSGDSSDRQTIDRIRISVNAAAARPLRLKAVEDAVRGKPRNAATGEMAGKLAVQGAIPLQFNAYKIPLMRNLVKRAIVGVERQWRRQHGLLRMGDESVGTTVPIHIAWFLIWVAVIAGFLFFIVHATYLRYFAKPKEFAGTISPEAARIPKHVPRHSLTARLFHWIMAASMFTLLFTAFPSEGWRPVSLGDLSLDRGRRVDRFHSFHVIHASFFMDFWAIWPDRIDLRDAWRRRCAGFSESRASSGQIRQISFGEQALPRRHHRRRSLA
jgi:hypothetical protein